MNHYARYGLEVTVKRCFDYSPDAANEWDELLANSTFNSIFQTSHWLRACIDTYCDAASLLVPEVRKNNQLVAAAAFRERDGVIEFAGRERSDYCDVLLSRDLEENDAIKAMEALLLATCGAATKFRHFLLERIPVENGTASYLQSPQFRLFPRITRNAVAPSMEMTATYDNTRKKSQRQKENKLRREGTLEFDTFTRAADILPKLDEFFEQHIERWQETPSPSLFLEEKNKQFYRQMIDSLDQTGWLRFTLVRLDGKMIAAHLGWFHEGHFYWYKPTFDIKLKDYSPGEVLLKRTIEQAVEDHAEEFDFLLGDEAYKKRFATRTRNLVSLEIDAFWLPAFTKRIRRVASRSLRILNLNRRAS